ncbi:MAG: undecaprenyl-phosphate glucose phosphotransferase [Alicyclobacillus sp.]|nr:undecaprenyl-phosphate glucose phosphotransferase [Alicyclobacillus sp.]
MFRTYQQLFNRLLMCLDALIVILSFAVAWWLKFDSGLLTHRHNQPLWYYRGPLLFGVITFIASNGMAGLYQPMRAKSLFLEAYNIGKSLVFGLLFLMSALYFAKMEEFSREGLALFAVSFFILMLVERLSIRFALRAMRRRGFNQRFVIMVGWSHAADRFVDALEGQPWFGYRLIGCLVDGDNEQESDGVQPRSVHGIPVLGTVQDLERVLGEHLVDQVVIAMPRDRVDIISHVIAACEAMGVQSLILPDYFDLLPARPRFETFGDIPLIDTRYVPLDDAMNAAIKRGFDIVFSALVMLIFSPLFLALCIAVKLSSPGPVFFIQERVGKNRRVFRMYKFRTMRWDEPLTAEERDDKESARTRDLGWTVKDDPRRTRLGAFLRKTSLDELPQFWNVFIGDMSVIGPRPERPVFVDHFKDEIPRYMVKHRVRPGITGWAQVHGWRGDTSIAERIRYDIEYIENWSFWMDMRIVWKTIKDGFVHENAY